MQRSSNHIHILIYISEVVIASYTFVCLIDNNNAFHGSFCCLLTCIVCVGRLCLVWNLKDLFFHQISSFLMLFMIGLIVNQLKAEIVIQLRVEIGDALNSWLDILVILEYFCLFFLVHFCKIYLVLLGYLLCVVLWIISLILKYWFIDCFICSFFI